MDLFTGLINELKTSSMLFPIFWLSYSQFDNEVIYQILFGTFLFRYNYFYIVPFQHGDAFLFNIYIGNDLVHFMEICNKGESASFKFCGIGYYDHLFCDIDHDLV